MRERWIGHNSDPKKQNNKDRRQAVRVVGDVGKAMEKEKRVGQEDIWRKKELMKDS